MNPKQELLWSLWVIARKSQETSFQARGALFQVRSRLWVVGFGRRTLHPVPSNTQPVPPIGKEIGSIETPYLEANAYTTNFSIIEPCKL